MSEEQKPSETQVPNAPQIPQVPQNADEARKLIQSMMSTVVPTAIAKIQSMDQHMAEIDAKLDKIKDWIKELYALQRRRS